MQDLRELLQRGRRVAVTQQVAQAKRVWTIRVEGEVVRHEQEKTVSPFAHSRDGTLWLDRLVLRKDDGEIVNLNLNGFSRVEAAPRPTTAAIEGQTGAVESVPSRT